MCGWWVVEEVVFERRVKNGAKFWGWGIGGGVGSVSEWTMVFGALGSAAGRVVVVSGRAEGRREGGGGGVEVACLWWERGKNDILWRWW